MTIQKSPYLQGQRQFPYDNTRELANQVDHAYIQIAQQVNSRVIGLFALGNQIVTGEKWYLSGPQEEQQTLRQIYTLTGAGNIAHGINFATVALFTRIFGTFTDGTNWYPLPYVDVSAANNQVNVYLSPTNIVITAGGGSPPTITSGIVVLEWLSQV
jgi:hypothetical protein